MKTIHLKKTGFSIKKALAGKKDDLMEPSTEKIQKKVIKKEKPNPEDEPLSNFDTKLTLPTKVEKSISKNTTPDKNISYEVKGLPDIEAFKAQHSYNDIIKQDSNIFDDVPEDRRALLIALGRYRMSKRFGGFLKQNGFNLDPKYLNALGIPELEHVVADIRFLLSNKNVSNLWYEVGTKGLIVVEKAVDPFYTVKGLAQTLNASDSYLDALEELILEENAITYMSPRKRFVLEIIKGVYICHTNNEMFEELSKTEEGRTKLREFAKMLGADSKGSPSLQTPSPASTIPSASENSKARELNVLFKEKYSDLLN